MLNLMAEGNRGGLLTTSLALCFAVCSLVAPTAVASSFGQPGDVFATDNGGDGPGRVVKYDPVTGQTTVISDGGLLSNPVGVAVYYQQGCNTGVLQDGDLLVGDIDTPTTGFCFNGCGAIILIRPDGPDEGDAADQSIVASGPPFVNPGGLAVARDGTLLIADQNANEECPVNTGGGVFTIPPPTTLPASPIPLSGCDQLYRPYNIAFAPTGGALVVDPQAFTDTDAERGPNYVGRDGGVLSIYSQRGANAPRDRPRSRGANRHRRHRSGDRLPG